MAEYAIWQTWGPMFTAHRYRGQPLGISYTDGVDTRFNDIMVPGPKFTAIDLSGVGGTTANLNSSAFKDISSVTYLYVGRGTDPARIKISDMSVTDPGISLTERVTDVLFTKNGSGVEEITFFMAGDEYRVITTFNAAGSDTVTAHASQIIRIAGLAGSLVAGFSEEAAYSIDLSGSAEMETGTWVGRAIINGDDCTPTGFATDGITWVWAMCRGPAILNPVRNTFELVFDRVSNSTRNGAQTKSLATIGTLIPMDRVLMHLQDGHLSVHAGPEAFPENDGTILGTVTAFDFDGDWGLMALYNEEADKTYLLAFRPRQPEDNHGELLSYYCLGTQTEECEHILYMAKKGGRTNPTWLLGKDSNAQYLTAGRDQQWYTDANYEFATNVTQSAYMTELRAMPGEDILPRAFFFETSGTTEAQYVDIYVSVNGGTAQYVGRADRPGRLRFDLGGALADTRCWRIQPILKLYNASGTSGYPAVVGPLHMEYDIVPADMAQVSR